MKHHIVLASLLCLVCSSPADGDSISFGSGPNNQFSMEFVEIGNPNNHADTNGNPIPAGSVSYTYQMGKFEVSEDMIEKFNASQSLKITKDTRGANKPATRVSWNEAARFVNWLNTSHGHQAAYKFTTDGVNDNIALWNSADAGFDATNLFRNSLARYVLPSYDEWHKAAYYDPETASYFEYSTSDGSVPTAVAGGTTADTAVYGRQDGPADITNAGGLSPYGVMGLGGNVWEWEESEYFIEFDPVNNDPAASRGSRGGDWWNGAHYFSSSYRNDNWGEGGIFGLRVASLSSVAVPVPSSLVLMLTGLAAMGWFGRRRLRK